jgi:hypothetical protein
MGVKQRQYGMSADIKINISIKITILVQISNMYVKQQEPQMITKISKVGY